MSKHHTLQVDIQAGSLYLPDGTFVSALPPGFEKFLSSGEATVLELAKLGYSAQDIIDLKRQGAI